MTMEEYIKFEEEKARRRGRVFNWQTATYGKIRVDDGLYDLGSVEAKFPTIVIDDTVTPQDALPISFDPKRHYKDGDCVIMLRRLRMRMEHRDNAGVVVFTSRAWGRLFDTRGPLVRELIMEFLSTLRFGEVLLDFDAPGTIQFQLGRAKRRLSWSESERIIHGKGDLHDYWRDISTDGDFLGPPPSYMLIRDLVLRLCHRMMAHSIAGRSQAPEKVTGTDLFYLRGLDVGSVNIPYLLAWYPRRFATRRKNEAHISRGQFVARLVEHFGLLTVEILGGLTVIAPELPIIDMVELDAQIVNEGGQADPIPVHAPPPAPTRTMPQRMAIIEEDVHEIRGTRISYQRRVRKRTNGASTSAAQQDPQQPDP
ncbi:hypothetical protein Tco_1285386 [Tanacetum coccineum]